MKTPFLLASCSLIIVSAAPAQDLSSRPVSKIAIKDFSFQFGGIIASMPASNLDDFRKLAPQSVLLNNELKDDFAATTENTIGYAAFSLAVGIQFANNERTGYRPNPLLRIGVTYFSGTKMQNDLYYNVRTPADTLVSNQTGQNFYFDSLTQHYYSMEYASQQIHLDGSLIYRTNPNARWSLYTGIGITGGISMNAHTEIIEFNSSQLAPADLNSCSAYGYSYGYTNSSVEHFRNKTGFALASYVPMGVDFRIAKKQEFFKRLHLFYEMRPGITLTAIPELRTITQTFFSFNLGLRFQFE
jgi:hypothetical protein